VIYMKAFRSAVLKAAFDTEVLKHMIS
jgi:hypothetical protein